MTRPEDALERAREGVATMRAAGAYLDQEPRPRPEPAPGGTRRKLLEWALIEPDEDSVRSTRRHGGAITALKRALLRLLSQYLAQLVANQSRFNLTLLAHLEQLEQRVEELEQRAGDAPAREPGPDVEAPGG